MISADDLTVFLEVSRRGRLVEAAKHLQINHTTVSRHIARLERAVGQRLFDRHADGWTVTPAGTQLLVHAEGVESSLIAAREECFSQGSKLSGRIRVIAPDGFGTYLLLPSLADLHATHPSLIVEVATANRHSTLTPREFDVAVTIEKPYARAVELRKLVDYTLSFYAAPHYLGSHDPVATLEDLYGHSLIWYVDDALDLSTFNLLHELLPEIHPRIQANNIAGHIEAAKSGLGVAFLPTFIGDRIAELRRLPVATNTTRSYWVSIPRDLRRLARVRVLCDHIDDLVARNRSTFVASPV
ncbi:LysR family transcriptional regulator [Mycobacterium sp. 21AC1]|uniref:LysR family transcriptional regulator n=1 Tax=[Mycobacterium] appelbergii TaxID=2939269 RepID=UPI002938F436|nr:LysR family transcriptional regulator [Mycobacterium sp. 21AC1]MDV3125954.1 LysR family transcriptional regulator [Mycobacterium sp. 21AC1]